MNIKDLSKNMGIVRLLKNSADHVGGRLTNQAILLFMSVMLMLGTGACADEVDYPDDPYGNFDALADIIDSRYCFFADKEIDWEEVTKRYRARITPQTHQLELFRICAEMLDELKDGHVNLSSRFNTSYYRAWWSEYPQDFNLRTLQEYYLKFDYGSTSGMLYKYFPEEKAGYIYYPSFSSGISELNLDYVLAQLYDADSLIIDIRDNGGGLLTNIDVLIGRLIEGEIPGGSISHKTGPGHDDFSKPYDFTYKSAPDYRVHFLNKPVYILTNRSCYSAANAFTAVAKSLPNVKIVGARTGGGGGLPFSSELPNGWSIRFSASPLYGPDGEITEFGIDPSEGYECHSPEKELAQGRDGILERALELCRANARPD